MFKNMLVFCRIVGIATDKTASNRRRRIEWHNEASKSKAENIGTKPK